jgi:catechol 2,3-dioxygenase-like lactoylglutathione lyase family enzyme
MTSRIATVAINVIDVDLIADFWCAVLNWQRIEEDDDGVSIGPADGSWPAIDLWPVTDEKRVVNRLHFDLRADGVTVEQELRRLIALGATRVDVGQPPEASWVVLADPEGNEFCLLSRTVQEVV